MSFNSRYKHAANPNLPMGVRYLRFIETCSSFGGLSRCGMQDVYDALGERFSFSRDNKPDAAQLTLALNTIVQVRFHLLYLAVQTRVRKRLQKQRGDWRKVSAPFTPQDVLAMLRQGGVANLTQSR